MYSFAGPVTFVSENIISMHFFDNNVLVSL